jgi:hypothetical protein
MIDMITQRTQPTTITKVRAQANIVGNEHVDKIATDGNKLPDRSLKDIARKFPNINKWTNDTNIDNETSNTFWGHPDITDHQSSNLDTINIWVMRTNNYSLVLLYTLILYAQYITHQNQIPGNTYYFLVLNSIFMPSELKDIIKQSGKYAN